MGEPSEFLDAVARHYPDFCRRWRDLEGLGPDEIAALATFEGEAVRVNECLAGACVDFSRRYAGLPAADIPEMQRQAAEVLKTAVLNGFVLGVWVAQQGLAKYPVPPAREASCTERHPEQICQACGGCQQCSRCLPTCDGVN